MSVARAITTHFGGDWHGTYGTFPTLGHSNRDRGMKVEDKPGAPDGVLIHSFNGGDPLAVKDECRRLGLLPPLQSRHADASETSRRREDWRETGHYEYVDADGAVAYRTVRLEKAGEPKRFSAQRPDGKGGWVNGLGEILRIPYRLPELIAADPAEPVYFVEGERKADRLVEMGFTATAIAFGCKGWRSEYARHFDGRIVVILPDNDQPGRKFAASVQAAVESAIIVELPGLPPKGDIIDWTGTDNDLRALVNATLNEPPETFPLADLVTWSGLAATPKTFAMARLIPAVEVTLFTGPAGANKSTFALQASACHSLGIPMLGVEMATGPALYVTVEDDERETHWRLANIVKRLGVPIAALAGKLHIASLRGRLNNELATFDAEGRIHPTPAFDLLRNTIVATEAKFVVLDNLGHLYAGNENDRGQATAFINLLYSLCRDLGATIVLVAHPNKAGDSYSGSTAWLNSVRSQIVLERPENSIDPDERVLRLGKANYARQGETLAFRWHDFALVRDEDLPADIRSEIAANAQANAENDAFLRCLAASTEARRAVSHNPGTNYFGTIFPRMTEGKEFAQQAYERAFERLLHLGKIKLDQPLWQDAHRHWKQGIKAAETCGDPPAATPCGDLRQPHGKVIDNTAATVRAATPPIYYVYKGRGP